MKKELKYTTINVEGMTCHNCAKGLETHLKKNGITSVSVNFALGEVIFETENKKSTKKIEKLINQLGYTTSISQNKKISKTEKYFYISLLFTFPLILHMFP